MGDRFSTTCAFDDGNEQNMTLLFEQTISRIFADFRRRLFRKYNRLIIGVFYSAAQFVKVWRKWSITTTTDKPTLRHHHLLRESRQVEKSPLLFAADAVSCFSLSPQLPLHDDEQSQHKSIIIPLLVWALFFDGVSPASCKRRTCPWLTKCFLTLLSY